MAKRSEFIDDETGEIFGASRQGTAEPNYFTAGREKEGLQFTSMGFAVGDECLGGGPVMGRVINIVGDKSTGKTLQAMEIAAQTLRRYPNAWCRYGESEAAFDREYSEALGIPVDKILLNPDGQRLETVEDWYNDTVTMLDRYPDQPGVYIIDSLDALSDDAEMDGEFNKASYGGGKPKAIGQYFRRLIGRLEKQNVLLVVISQLRDKIGVTFGETKTRSGGKALDYYASQIVWLADLGQVKQTRGGIDRVVGRKIRMNVKKNKIGLAHRTADYEILFGYGIDDLMACAEWLIENKCGEMLHELGMKAGAEAAPRARTKAEAAKPRKVATDDKLTNYKTYIEKARNAGGATARELRDGLAALVRRAWPEIESKFLPASRKYEDV